MTPPDGADALGRAAAKAAASVRGRAGPGRFALRLAAGCAAGALLLAGSDVRQTRDRPPPAHTGGFNEPTCLSCHFDGDINEGPGSLVIDGLPGHYAAGETYTFAVVLTDPALAAAGFQLAVRFKADGRQAGSLAAAPDDVRRVEVTTEHGIQYAHHGPAGVTPVETRSTRWSLQWTAPAESAAAADDRDRAVVVHAVGNAADGDDSPLGDWIYTDRQLMQPQRPSTSGRSTSRR